MEAQGLNLYIVDDNISMVTALKQYLQNRFGNGVKISTFYSGDSCLKRINKDTDIVVLDYYMDGKNGLETLKSIKEINPETEVIMLSSNEDIGMAIESYKEGASEYIVKGPTAWKRLSDVINNVVTAPIRFLEREFGVSKFTAIFLMTFITIGIVVVTVLKFFPDLLPF
jgi:two-component system OmpR family response regulator